jgi:histidinol-phosphate phosphatase family protein
MKYLPEQIDKSWTLFLDRDGVINEEIYGSYVTQWRDFRFCTGALEALAYLNDIFGTIVVVTNQRGVGRGIMTLENLKDIHTRMITAIQAHSGRVDHIYSCTDVADAHRNRKPNVGMALQAKEDFSGIDFKRAVMVGNSVSDMEFGKRMAMHTVFLTTKLAPFPLPHDLIDEQFDSLLHWSKTLTHSEACV